MTEGVIESEEIDQWDSFSKDRHGASNVFTLPADSHCNLSILDTELDETLKSAGGPTCDFTIESRFRSESELHQRTCVSWKRPLR